MSRIELAAWRFLSSRRCPGLAVAHIEFIDGPKPVITAPANDLGFYESATAETFGEAAVKLALKLGMPPARIRIDPTAQNVLRPGEKLCTYCDPPQWREVIEFTRHPGGVGGIDNRCNWCRSRYRRERRLFKTRLRRNSVTCQENTNK